MSDLLQNYSNFEKDNNMDKKILWKEKEHPFVGLGSRGEPGRIAEVARGGQCLSGLLPVIVLIESKLQNEKSRFRVGKELLAKETILHHNMI